jgi:predicted GNAT family acetyltransferase
MVAIPSERRWDVRTLTEKDRHATLQFLNRQPLLNVYLISRILDEGLSANVQPVAVSADQETICIASLTSNVVAAMDEDCDPGSQSTALALLAERILTRVVPVRAIISEAGLVEELWRNLGQSIEPPTVIRLRQPVYGLFQKTPSLTEMRNMRFAGSRDLEALVPACAAMHTEEVGIDPLSRDPVGYRQRVRELIAKQRSLIWKEHGRIVFKCEYSAVTPEAIQLMGVWTHPSLRRKGYARQGLSEICGHIVKQGKKVTLFVNDFNDAAVHLYESLGFRRIGENRALIW